MNAQITGFIRRIITQYILPFSLVWGASSVDELYHKPIQTHPSGENIIITLSTVGNVLPIEGTVYYRTSTQHHFQEIPMRFQNAEWKGIIPGEQVVAPALEYLVILWMNETDVIAFPRENPFDTPYRIIITPKERTRQFPNRGKTLSYFDETVESNMMILSPEQGETLHRDQVVIAVSFFGVMELDPESIQIVIDEKDFTDQAEIGSGLISLVPKKLKPGNHIITVFAQNIHGMEMIPIKWNFNVVKYGLDITDKFVYDGSLSWYLSTEKVVGNVLNISEVTGKINGSLNWINTVSNFRMTTRETPYQQSYNRVSSTIKMGEYLTVFAGDFYPHLSSYLIAGRRIRGLGVSLSFPWLKLDIITGELNRAVQWRGDVNQGYTLNSMLTEVKEGGGYTYFLDRTGYTFTRKIDTYRLSLNYKSTFHFGLYFLKSADEPGSVSQRIPSEATFTVDTLATGITPGDYTFSEFQTALAAANGTLNFPSSKWSGGNPEDNLVIGFDTKTYFDQRQISAEFSWNLSLYNRNIWDGAMSRTEMDTTLDDSLDGLIGVQYDEHGLITGTPLMIDTTLILNPVAYEGIFTINPYMTPLVPFDYMSYEKHPIATIINMPSSAFHLRLNGRYPGNSFHLEYRQVGPEFVSFGNPYFTGNIREFTIGDRLTMLDHKLIINLNYKYQDNKILRSEIDPLRTYTFAFGVTLIPGQNVPSFTLNVHSINRNKDIDDFGDGMDMREQSRTSNALFSVNLPFEIVKTKNTLTINYNTVNNTDLLSERRHPGYIFPKTDTKTISVNITNRISPTLRTIFNAFQTEIFLPTAIGVATAIDNVKWRSMGFGIHYAMFNNKIRFMGNFSTLSSSDSAGLNFLNGKMGCEVDIWKNVRLRFAGNLQLNENHLDQTDEDETENEPEKPSTSTWEMNTSGLQLSINYTF